MGSKDRSFELGHDGKIKGYHEAQDQRRSWTDQDAAQLELAAQAPRRGSVLEDLPAPPRTRRSAARPLVILGAFVAVVVLSVTGWRLERSRPAKASGLVMIDSVPSGATLYIEGVAVGQTPYVAPNGYAPGTVIPVRVSYPGADDWTGEFPGGVETSFMAELKSKVR